MCGIAGAVSFIEHPDREAVAEVVRRQSHRGPDATGLWSSPDDLCVLGHNRLSIIDLSPSANQPMLDPETGNAIVYNGETYNFRELRQECETLGYRFRSASDTEVVLALYRLFEVEAITRLRGMFALALWDHKRRRLLLARDRFGEKPLFYSFVNGMFLFASEIGPLARHPLIQRDIDPEALELYLQFQFIPAPWSIYRGVRKLEPAHLAILDEEGLHMRRYWQVDYNRKTDLNEGEALDALEEKIDRAVRMQMVADVPLGAALSGGVDSGLVTALMARHAGEPVRTFTISFEEQDKDESPYARAVAEHVGSDHHEFTVRGEVHSVLPDVVRHYGEPFGDTSAVPTFYLCEFASQSVKVMMTGDGGDEMLGGYHRYAIPGWRTALSPLLDRLRDPAGAARWFMESSRRPPKPLWKLLFRYVHPEYRGLLYNQFFTHRARRNLLGERTTGVVGRFVAQRLEEAMAHSLYPTDRLSYLDSSIYLPGDLLVKTDIAAMRSSLETRVPLLDHDVFEFCASLPPTLKTRRRTGKYLLKRLAERHIPSHVINRPKMGFTPPIRSWLTGPLRSQAEELLRDTDAMAPLAPDAVAQVAREFFSGQSDHGQRIWLLFIYGLWSRLAHQADH